MSITVDGQMSSHWQVGAISSCNAVKYATKTKENIFLRHYLHYFIKTNMYIWSNNCNKTTEQLDTNPNQWRRVKICTYVCTYYVHWKAKKKIPKDKLRINKQILLSKLRTYTCVYTSILHILRTCYYTLHKINNQLINVLHINSYCL